MVHLSSGELYLLQCAVRDRIHDVFPAVNAILAVSDSKDQDYWIRNFVAPLSDLDKRISNICGIQ